MSLLLLNETVLWLVTAQIERATREINFVARFHIIQLSVYYERITIMSE